MSCSFSASLENIVNSHSDDLQRGKVEITRDREAILKLDDALYSKITQLVCEHYPKFSAPRHSRNVSTGYHIPLGRASEELRQMVGTEVTFTIKKFKIKELNSDKSSKVARLKIDKDDVFFSFFDECVYKKALSSAKCNKNVSRAEWLNLVKTREAFS